MDSIRQIAAGDAVPWEQTFQHPKYGELTARISDMPKNKDWLRHANETDRLIREFGGDPDEVATSTQTFAAALAGFRIIFEPIVIAERRQETDEAGHERIEKDYYDPLEDEDPGSAMGVWVEFWAWRRNLLERVDDLGKSSGETTGSESDGSSPAGTVSPSMIPA